MPKGTKAAQSAITELFKKHTSQTNEQCCNDMEPGFKFCICKDLASNREENDEHGTMLITYFVSSNSSHLGQGFQPILVA